jgi:glycosyltransferase involved in cell wall biosynthesis
MESVFNVLLKGLREKGYKAFPVYCNDSHAHQENEISGEAKNVKVSAIQTNHKIPKISSIKGFFKSLSVIHETLRAVKPEVVNCHFIDFRSIYFAILKPFFNYKLVLTCHGSDIVQPSRLDQSVLPFLFWASDHVVGVSSFLVEKASRFANIAKKSTTIYNGIDVEFWSSTDRDGTPPPVIISVGSLVSVKGHDILVDAFKYVQSRLPDSELVLVGSGEMEKPLKKQAESLGLAENVTFTGWLEKREIRRFHERASVFALPSRSEGLGIALLEAMAAGLPCVAADVGGIPEVISDSTVGTLVPPNDSEALAHALLEILKDRKRASRLAHNARQRAKAFSWKNTLDQYEDVFQSV